MSKPPKEQARDYVWHNYGEGDFNEHNWDRSAEEIWLAGYRAAQDRLLAQFKSLLSSFAETSFNPSHTAWQMFDILNDQVADVSKVMNSPEKLDSCEHILDMEKMVDVNFSSGWISVKERLPKDEK